MGLKFTLLDGAMGTQISKRGFNGGMCAEAWNLEHPQAVIEIQKAYADAGSDIIYTPTFGANRICLERGGITGKVEEYNIRLTELTRKAAPGKLAAGDISPTGLIPEPFGNVTSDFLEEVYREQAAALEKAGVDLFVVETMMYPEEAMAAVRAVKSVSDKDIFVSFTCDKKGRTLLGADICDILGLFKNSEYNAVNPADCEASGNSGERLGIKAFGLNCSVGPADMLPQLQRLSAYMKDNLDFGPALPLIAKANAGLPRVENGRTVYDLSPAEFASFIPGFVEAGAVYIGGCCGTDESFLSAINALR